MTLMNKQISAYPLRMPNDIKELLKTEAKTNDRSLHAELLLRLYASTDLPAPLTNDASEVEDIARRVAREEIAKASKK